MQYWLSRVFVAIWQLMVHQTDMHKPGLRGQRPSAPPRRRSGPTDARTLFRPVMSFARSRSSPQTPWGLREESARRAEQTVLLAAREQNRKLDDAEILPLFEVYLDGIARMAEVVDKL